MTPLTCWFRYTLRTQVTTGQVLSIHQDVVFTGMLVNSEKEESEIQDLTTRQRLKQRILRTEDGNRCNQHRQRHLAELWASWTSRESLRIILQSS